MLYNRNSGWYNDADNGVTRRCNGWYSEPLETVPTKTFQQPAAHRRSHEVVPRGAPVTLQMQAPRDREEGAARSWPGLPRERSALEGILFVIVFPVRAVPALPAAGDRDHWKPPFSLAGPARPGRAELFLHGATAARGRYFCPKSGAGA